VNTSQSLVVVLTIKLHMSHMLGFEFLHHIVDVIHTFGSFSHRLGGEVGVAARTIPVWEELWFKRDGETLKLSNSLEKISSCEHMITCVNSNGWTNLEFPLTWHNLSIGTRDSEASIKAALVVSISNGSSEAYITSNRAVVWTLVGWVTIGWPSIWLGLELVLSLQDCVFLLNTIPWDLILVGIENLFSKVSEIGVGWYKSRIGGITPDIGLAKYHDIITTSEGVWEEENWLHDDLRIFSGSLIT